MLFREWFAAGTNKEADADKAQGIEKEERDHNDCLGMLKGDKKTLGNVYAQLVHSVALRQAFIRPVRGIC